MSGVLALMSSTALSSILPVWSADFTAITTLPAQVTFSRAGNAMMYGTTGVLTYAPNNLLLNTATLSTQSVTTVAANYIISFYGTGSVVLSGTKSATINGTGAGNQVYLAFTATAGTLTATVSGSVTSAVLALVTYETTPRTNDQVINTSAAYYGPRFDNPGGTAAGLLVEESRTNYFLQSGSLSNASWSLQYTTLPASGTTDPTGATATKMLLTAASATHGIQQQVIGAAGAYSQSWYVKYGNNQWVGIGFYDGGWVGVAFDLVNHVVGNNSTGVAGTITAVGSGWYRITATYTAAGANPYGGLFLSNSNVFQAVYTGAGTEYVYLGLSQMEIGAFTTSYVPTVAATVTRAAESVTSTNGTLTGAQAWIVETGSLQAATASTLLGINTSIGLGESSSNYLTTTYGGTQTSGATATWTGNMRGGIAWDSTPRVAISLNGGTVVSAANSTSAPTTLTFGSTNSGASAFINGYLRKAAAYATLTNTQLATKSVVGAAF